MIYLSDNDIVEKLAVCDLLDDALAAFEAARSDVYVIPTLKSRIGGRSRPKAERRLGAPAVARILSFLEDVREVRDYSAADHELLDEVVGIDPGETVLLAATGVCPDFRLLTGDKRCIRTLCAREECRPIALRVQGRVVCFEQVVLRLIRRQGFAYVLDKIVPVSLGFDTALRVAFGSGFESTEANAVAALESYVGELRGLAVDVLEVDG